MSKPVSEIARAVEQENWRFAKTMRFVPHWYTVRREWLDEAVSFDEVLEYINDFGYDDPYHGVMFKAVELNGFKYWPGTKYGTPASETTIINRKPVQPNSANFHGTGLS